MGGRWRWVRCKNSNPLPPGGGNGASLLCRRGKGEGAQREGGQSSNGEISGVLGGRWIATTS